MTVDEFMEKIKEVLGKDTEIKSNPPPAPNPVPTPDPTLTPNPPPNPNPAPTPKADEKVIMTKAELLRLIETVSNKEKEKPKEDNDAEIFI